MASWRPDLLIFRQPAEESKGDGFESRHNLDVLNEYEDNEEDKNNGNGGNQLQAFLEQNSKNSTQTQEMRDGQDDSSKMEEMDF